MAMHPDADPHMTQTPTAPAVHTDVYPAISPEVLAGSMKARSVLVSGAGRGIGRAIALAFARAGAAHIAIMSRTKSELDSLANEIKASHPETKTLVCVADVTDRAALTRSLSEIEETFGGGVDVLVANAGMNAFRPFAYTPGEEWWRVIEVNLKGPMMLAEMVLPAMRKRNDGAIIFVSSRAGVVNVVGASSYCVSKTGLVRACSCLQLELDSEAGGTSGIHTYSLHPGGVRSDMTLAALHPDVDKMQKGFSDRLRNSYDSIFIHAPELCAQTCVYLASGRATALRGRYIDVEDDIEALVRQADIIKREGMYNLKVDTLGVKVYPSLGTRDAMKVG